MRHAEQDGAGAAGGSIPNEFVEHWDEHPEPFNREARLAGVSAMQESLEGRDFRQAVEQLAFVNRVPGRPKPLLLDRIKQPSPLGRIGHMRELITAGGAVDGSQALDRVQRCCHPVGLHDRTADDGRRQLG
jgi:hypothetical protein